MKKTIYIITLLSLLNSIELKAATFDSTATKKLIDITVTGQYNFFNPNTDPGNEIAVLPGISHYFSGSLNLQHYIGEKWMAGFNYSIGSNFSPYARTESRDSIYTFLQQSVGPELTYIPIRNQNSSFRISAFWDYTYGQMPVMIYISEVIPDYRSFLYHPGHVRGWLGALKLQYQYQMQSMIGFGAYIGLNYENIHRRMQYQSLAYNNPSWYLFDTDQFKGFQIKKGFVSAGIQFSFGL